MTKKELDKNGIMLAEKDSYNGGIYLGTRSLYLYDGGIYCHTYNDNRMTYSGKENTIAYYGCRDYFFSYYHNIDWKISNLVDNINQILTKNEIEKFHDFTDILFRKKQLENV